MIDIRVLCVKCLGYRLEKRSRFWRRAVTGTRVAPFTGNCDDCGAAQPQFAQAAVIAWLRGSQDPCDCHEYVAGVERTIAPEAVTP